MKTDRFGRYSTLRAQWNELTPSQRAYAIREREILRETHTFFASWSVAMTRARLHADAEEGTR